MTMAQIKTENYMRVQKKHDSMVQNSSFPVLWLIRRSLLAPLLITPLPLHKPDRCIHTNIALIQQQPIRFILYINTHQDKVTTSLKTAFSNAYLTWTALHLDPIWLYAAIHSRKLDNLDISHCRSTSNTISRQPSCNMGRLWKHQCH